MLARYFTPEDDKIEDSINEKIHKIPSRKERDEKRQQEITERICQKCGVVHDKNFQFCSNCGAPLTEAARVRVQSETERLESLIEKYLTAKK